MHPTGLRDAENKALVDQRVQGYFIPKELYINNCAEGVAALAASIYPKRIMVRLSDFQPHKYECLMDGEDYIWAFPKIRDTLLGVPIIRTIVFGSILGYPYLEKLPYGPDEENPMRLSSGDADATLPFYEEHVALDLEVVTVVKMGLKKAWRS